MDLGQPSPSTALPAISKQQLVLHIKRYRYAQRQHEQRFISSQGWSTRCAFGSPAAVVKANTVVITGSIGNGPGTGTAWGCDLSYDL